jgi:hypothetical protein
LTSHKNHINQIDITKSQFSPKKLCSKTFSPRNIPEVSRFIDRRKKWLTIQNSTSSSTQSFRKTTIYSSTFFPSKTLFIHFSRLLFLLLFTSLRHFTNNFFPYHFSCFTLLCLFYTRTTSFFLYILSPQFSQTLWTKKREAFLFFHAYENSIYKLFVLESIEIASNDDKFPARFVHSGIFISRKVVAQFFSVASSVLLKLSFLNWNVMLWNKKRVMA